MKRKVFSIHLNLGKLEHHYRITSRRFHTYTFLTHLPPLHGFFLGYKTHTDITDHTFIRKHMGWLFGQPRRLEWDPLMICAPPALRYSLLAAMQVGGVVGGIVSLGRDFLGKSEEWLGRMGKMERCPTPSSTFSWLFFLKLGSIMFNDHWVGICWELVATIFTADVGNLLFSFHFTCFEVWGDEMVYDFLLLIYCW